MHRDIVTSGANWAAAAHFGRLHNGAPSKHHLEEVVAKLLDIETLPGSEASEDTVAAAWLHDTLRYTDTCAAEIGKTLGRRVGQLVTLTTDPGARGVSRTPEERAESKRLAYLQFQAETDVGLRAEAGLIRCVDRFVNMRSAIAQKVQRKIEVYRMEWPDFVRVYGVTLLDPRHPHRQRLWNELFLTAEDLVLRST